MNKPVRSRPACGARKNDCSSRTFAVYKKLVDSVEDLGYNDKLEKSQINLVKSLFPVCYRKCKLNTDTCFAKPVVTCKPPTDNRPPVLIKPAVCKPGDLTKAVNVFISCQNKGGSFKTCKNQSYKIGFPLCCKQTWYSIIIRKRRKPTPTTCIGRPVKCSNQSAFDQRVEDCRKKISKCGNVIKLCIDRLKREFRGCKVKPAPAIKPYVPPKPILTCNSQQYKIYKQKFRACEKA